VLKDTDGTSITDSCDFRFILYDADIGGAQVGLTQEMTAVSVAEGYFMVGLDFGDTVFTGEARWLEVGVKCSGEADYTILSPRQALTASPYATYAQTVGDHSHWGDTWSGTGTGLILSEGTWLGNRAPTRGGYPRPDRYFHAGNPHRPAV
jgi:hypothetical protein